MIYSHSTFSHSIFITNFPFLYLYFLSLHHITHPYYFSSFRGGGDNELGRKHYSYVIGFLDKIQVNILQNLNNDKLNFLFYVKWLNWSEYKHLCIARVIS